MAGPALLLLAIALVCPVTDQKVWKLVVLLSSGHLW